MLEKEVLDQDLENAFAEMASSLDLQAPDDVAPWGFMAVAAFTPGEQTEPMATSAELASDDVAAIWSVVSTYHNLAAGVEIQSVDGSSQAIAEITKGIQGATTDPFYCVLPNDTYAIPHASVQQEVEGVLHKFFDADIYKPKSPVSITPRDSPWLVGPDIAAVTYRADAMGDAKEQLQSQCFSVLFKQYGAWKLNIISSEVLHAQGSAPTKG